VIVPRRKATADKIHGVEPYRKDTPWTPILQLHPWVNVSDYGPAGGEINKAIVEAFRARGIAITPPRRDVRLLGGTAPGELRAA